jgi:hypothetical protein
LSHRAAALLLAAAAAPALAAPMLPTKLGIYDYFTDETSPLLFNGVPLLMESIVWDSPEHAGHWLPAFNSSATCASYFRVRNVATNAVLANVSASCNHAFGFGLVLPGEGEGGGDLIQLWGTPWNRQQALPPSSARRRRRGRVGWSGPCDTPGNCTVNAFSSSDLVNWAAAVPAATPRYAVYNTDVAPVAAPSTPAAAARAAAAGLPPMRWIMALEDGPSGSFAYSNDVAPTNNGSWTFLDPAVYNLGHPGQPGQVGSCPSVRYDPSSGYFYVLTGGYVIFVLRSTDLRGPWELAATPLLSPDAADCALAPPAWGGGYSPSPVAAAHLATCTATGFGNDSDVDMTELVVDGVLSTLWQYGSGDQKSFGFSNYALSNASLFTVLGSFF